MPVAYTCGQASAPTLSLVRLLHSSGLRLALRLKLYCACVRSALLYGQHAIGYSLEVLRSWRLVTRAG